MNQDQLAAFKGSVRTFHSLYEACADYFSGNHEYMVIAVLIQNLGFDGRDSMGYDHHENVDKCQQIIILIDRIANYYPDKYMCQWAKHEISILWETHRYDSDEEILTELDEIAASRVLHEDIFN